MNWERKGNNNGKTLYMTTTYKGE